MFLQTPAVVSLFDELAVPYIRDIIKSGIKQSLILVEIESFMRESLSTIFSSHDATDLRMAMKVTTEAVKLLFPDVSNISTDKLLRLMNTEDSEVILLVSNFRFCLKDKLSRELVTSDVHLLSAG